MVDVPSLPPRRDVKRFPPQVGPRDGISNARDRRNALPSRGCEVGEVLKALARTDLVEMVRQYACIRFIYDTVTPDRSVRLSGETRPGAAAVTDSLILQRSGPGIVFVVDGLLLRLLVALFRCRDATTG